MVKSKYGPLITAVCLALVSIGVGLGDRAFAQTDEQRFLRGVPSHMAIPVVRKGPDLAGDLSSPGWQQAGMVGTFFALDSPAGKAVRVQARADGIPGRVVRDDRDSHTRMIAYAVSDRENLYVAFVCLEPRVNKLVAKARDRDSDKVWSDDHVELLLDPANGGGWVYQWIVSPSGAFVDASQAATRNVSLPGYWEKAKAWNSNATVKTSVRKERWIVEMRIPLSDFGTAAFPGETWGINFARRRKVMKTPDISWSPCSGARHSGGDRDALVITQGGGAGLGHAVLTRGGSVPRVTVLSRGGAGAAFQDFGLNAFVARAANPTKKTVKVRLQVTADGAVVGQANGTLSAGATHTYRASYTVPEQGTPELAFIVSVDRKNVYMSTLLACAPVANPPRVWEVEDPLFEELFSDEGPGLVREGVLMWMHPIMKSNQNREAALRFAVRYSLNEMLQTWGDHGIIQVSDSVPTGEDAVQWEKYGQRNMFYGWMLSMLPKDVPWILDSRAIDFQTKGFEEQVLKVPHPFLWGWCESKHFRDGKYQGAELMRNPPEGYDYIKQADEEVKEKYGGGKWGIPRGSRADENPYRRIAYHRWAEERSLERARRLYEVVQKHDPKLRSLSHDFPVAGVPCNELSRMAPYFDIFLSQDVPKLLLRQETPRPGRWRAHTGFMTKYLSDLTGKEVWINCHVERFPPVSTSTEEVQELLSQVFRNGGHGYKFYMADCSAGIQWGDTRMTYFGSPPRWRTILNVIDVARKMPRLKYPDYERTAILYNNDVLQTTIETQSDKPYDRRYWDTLEMLYTFLGPVAESWFKFVDCAQVLAMPSLNDRFDALYIADAIYQRPEIVARLRAFVENGGTLICGDPMAFSTDTVGNNTSESRRAVFGVDLGEKMDASAIVTKKAGAAKKLAVYSQAYKVVLEDGVDVQAEFEVGSPAITSHSLGKGRAVLFAFNPFQLDAAEDPAWRAFFTDQVKELGAPTDLDIWRFKYPDSVIANPEPLKGLCLTNNHVVWREEKHRYLNNMPIQGSYSYSKAPEAMPDERSEIIPFSLGRLTDRPLSIRAGKKQSGWYQPYALPASSWMVSWAVTEPVSVTFNLERSWSLNKVRLWFTDTMPEVTVEGKAIGKRWKQLGQAKGEDAGSEGDVLDMTIPLVETVSSRYVRINFAARQAGQKLSLVEVEVWANEFP